MAGEMSGEAADGGARSPASGAEKVADDLEPAREALARSRRWGGDELVREMAGIFLEDMPQRLAAARAALARGDGAGVALPAHTMKSSSAQLGATALERLCAAAESLAAEGEPSRAAPLLDAAADELARFSAWLRREAGAAGGPGGRGAAP